MSELAGKGCEIIVPFDERQPLKDIERSIIKKYRKHLWSKFIKAIRDYVQYTALNEVRKKYEDR